ncbi:DDE-type integrase/transposase/recombinase [Ornithobacterium rhinotracheale]|uniref:Integrase family protein n=2 Tax=Ornithobacterium rhinotracheale TaxID=28251 RepID=I4A370_ORNRL|nr:DDE-type integrase/transposase/recombinase [Ornithobacterium rhinotracheale]AFL98404.1 integrase family protein [Ornithobacterium rhinotracheale DSM 15997]MCK0201120.1 DDE-type integrase/transposase/recombinase [Ornithobacterium rhinotracheale]MCK0202463.1 DDE-type integrase/transposase/recombinase [Ornithobacterium rhinotracheale]UVD87183.1 DDE-type integrase/transposase/recombinase [Ornithobacterium rhinotracheale]
MQLQQGDILIRKNTEGDTLWVSERLVVQTCALSNDYLKFVRSKYKKSVPACYHNRDTFPATGKAWRWARINHQFYYDYDFLPDRVPKHYRSQFGTKEALKELLKEFQADEKRDLKQYAKEEIMRAVRGQISAENMRYFQFHAPVGFNATKAMELAEAMAWLNYIKLNYELGDFKHLGIRQKQEFLQLCAEILAPRNLEGLSIGNAHSLRNKISEFPLSLAEQRNYLISAKYGNDNARVVGKCELVDENTGEILPFDAHEAVMYGAYMNPFGTSKQSVAALYDNYYIPMITELGYAPLSRRTYNKYVARWDNQFLGKERHGKDWYKKNVLTYVPTKKLEYAHSLFTADGSGLLAYRVGKRVYKLYVMMITDVASQCIVGWSVASKKGHEETYEMLEKALKMAVRNSEGLTMFEFLSDNHGAYTSQESKALLNLVFHKVRTIEKGNSQANPAEMSFRLVKQSLKALPNLVSSSWKVGIEGMANPDYLEIEELPTYEEAILQFEECVKMWNNSPRRGNKELIPAKIFRERKHIECQYMDKRILRRLFGNHTQADISYMRGFVKVEKVTGYNRQTYLFEIPDYVNTGVEILAKATGYAKRVNVKIVWDEEMADLYTLDDVYIMSCPAAELAVQSHAEADMDTNIALSKHYERKLAHEEKADALRDEIGSIYSELPYSHAMKLGGNKKSYNTAMVLQESESLSEKEKIKLKRERIKRDFKW